MHLASFESHKPHSRSLTLAGLRQKFFYITEPGSSRRLRFAGEERESSKIGKMSGMSPPRTHVLGTEPHGRNHETWPESHASIVWETDIFVVISSVDGRTDATILARRQNNFPQGAEEREGSYIKDLRKIFGIFDPLPPLRIW